MWGGGIGTSRRMIRLIARPDGHLMSLEGQRRDNAFLVLDQRKAFPAKTW